MDWDRGRRERIRQLCQSEAILSLWQVKLDIEEDGSCAIERRIAGTNMALAREFYELETWADPEKDPTHEATLKKKRRLLVTANAGKENIYASKEFDPIIAHRVNRIVHLIPLTDGRGSLKPQEKFEIIIKEQTESGVFDIKGDYYQFKVQHLTERFKIEMLFPKNWRFPKAISPKEKLVYGEIKSPTLGQWVMADEKPEVERTRAGRTRITWEVHDAKLLSTLKLTYHAMEKA